MLNDQLLSISIKAVNLPAAFNVLISNLRGLSLDVDLIRNSDSENTEVSETE